MRDTEKIEVVGGIISPIHEQYQRGGVQLASNGNRREMIWMSILSSDWIRLSEWQMQQPTLIHDGFDEVLTYHQVLIFCCKFNSTINLLVLFLELSRFDIEW